MFQEHLVESPFLSFQLGRSRVTSRIFYEFPRWPQSPKLASRPWLLKGFWIVVGKINLQGVIIKALVALDDAQSRACYMSLAVQPVFAPYSNRFHDQSISLPCAGRVTHPGEIRRIEIFKAIGPDLPHGVIVFIDYEHPLVILNNLLRRNT